MHMQAYMHKHTRLHAHSYLQAPHIQHTQVQWREQQRKRQLEEREAAEQHRRNQAKMEQLEDFWWGQAGEEGDGDSHLSDSSHHESVVEGQQSGLDPDQDQAALPVASPAAKEEQAASSIASPSPIAKDAASSLTNEALPPVSTKDALQRAIENAGRVQEGHKNLALVKEWAERTSANNAAGALRKKTPQQSPQVRLASLACHARLLACMHTKISFFIHLSFPQLMHLRSRNTNALNHT